MKNTPIYCPDLIPIKQYFIENRNRWSSVFILVDSNTHKLCLPLLLSDVDFDLPVEILEIEAGEDSKDIEIATGLWLSLNELNADRKSLIINLGGGVVSDLGSWVAANYKRGIDFINIPTSLLAMVDASIGGKTGINLGAIKNLVGSFSLPIATFIFANFLDSLDDEEWSSGLAEMIKHALIKSKDQWNRIKELSVSDKKEIKSLIKESADVKVEIVDRDFYESGDRKILNFGHTFGHAIESRSIEIDQMLSHGHSIAIGIALESITSYQYGLLLEDEMHDILKCILKNYSLPTWIKNELPFIIQKMKKDKKNDGELIKMVLLKKIGDASFDNEIKLEPIAQAVNFLYSFSTNE